MSGYVHASSDSSGQNGPVYFSFTWTIADFSLALNEDLIISPIFDDGTTSLNQWCLKLHPFGSDPERGDNVSLYLHLESGNDAGVRARCKISIVDAEGNSIKNTNASEARPFFPGDGWGFKNLIRRDWLAVRHARCYPLDSLTIVCEVIEELAAPPAPEQPSVREEGDEKTSAEAPTAEDVDSPPPTSNAWAPRIARGAYFVAALFFASLIQICAHSLDLGSFLVRWSLSGESPATNTPGLENEVADKASQVDLKVEQADVDPDRHKLPALDLGLEKFDGDKNAFFGWWGDFKANVHLARVFEIGQKLDYLRTLLEGEAAAAAAATNDETASEEDQYYGILDTLFIRFGNVEDLPMQIVLRMLEGPRPMRIPENLMLLSILESTGSRRSPARSPSPLGREDKAMVDADDSRPTLCPVCGDVHSPPLCEMLPLPVWRPDCPLCGEGDLCPTASGAANDANGNPSGSLSSSSSAPSVNALEQSDYCVFEASFDSSSDSSSSFEMV